MADKDGTYCTICSGVVPGAVKIRRILVDGKEVGIDRPDGILDEVIGMGLPGEARVDEELLSRVGTSSYIPSLKADAYATAILEEYRLRLKMKG
jgi:hypothetical protein